MYTEARVQSPPQSVVRACIQNNVAPWKYQRHDWLPTKVAKYLTDIRGHPPSPGKVCLSTDSSIPMCCWQARHFTRFHLLMQDVWCQNQSKWSLFYRPTKNCWERSKWSRPKCCLRPAKVPGSSSSHMPQCLVKANILLICLNNFFLHDKSNVEVVYHRIFSLHWLSFLRFWWCGWLAVVGVDIANQCLLTMAAT